jgi:hypothetical protein
MDDNSTSNFAVQLVVQGGALGLLFYIVVMARKYLDKLFDMTGKQMDAWQELTSKTVEAMTTFNLMHAKHDEFCGKSFAEAKEARDRIDSLLREMKARNSRS